MQLTEKLVLRALQGEVLPSPPIWLMRQAGRYLPEYRAVREKAGSFLDLCFTPELAAEVTMQPIRRFGFDAAILFADILLVPLALGSSLEFSANDGPILSKIGSLDDVGKLKRANQIHQTLSPIYETIRILKSQLPQATALIGFAGSPWTVASYMIEGCGSPHQAAARAMLENDRETFFALLDLIADATVEYLLAQIAAGVEVVKLFDSWANSIPAAEFESCCLMPTLKIVNRLRSLHPSLPIIGFPRGSGTNYEIFAKTIPVSGLALDQSIRPEWALANIPNSVCLQGNLDPFLLETGGQKLIDGTRLVCQSFSGRAHIFNLGHGISPKVNPEHVKLMIDTVRNC